MFREIVNVNLLRLAGALLALGMLTACNAPVVEPTTSQPEATATQPAPQVTEEVEPTATVEQERAGGAGEVSLTVAGVAQDVTSEVIAAVDASAGGPYWELAPEHTVLTLSGYPVAGHMHTPRIYVYPVAELAATNEGAGKIAADLQALLQTQQAGKYLPFLPLFNAAQVMHAQVQYLDFQGGKGVRFLTQFDQAPLPINNRALFYTFQGLTNDGAYYVAAVLPVNLASLPADEQVGEQELPGFIDDFPAYLAEVVSSLDQQPASAFTPDLAALDAMMRSIEVK